jgi:hypothetical protein
MDVKTTTPDRSTTDHLAVQDTLAPATGKNLIVLHLGPGAASSPLHPRHTRRDLDPPGSRRVVEPCDFKRRQVSADRGQRVGPVAAGKQGNAAHIRTVLPPLARRVLRR